MNYVQILITCKVPSWENLVDKALLLYFDLVHFETLDSLMTKAFWAVGIKTTTNIIT